MNGKYQNIEFSELDNGTLGNSMNYRTPSNNNPMMNVPIVSYDSPQVYKDYYRYDKIKGPMSQQVKQLAEKDLVRGIPQNPEDYLYNRANSQRQWFSVANGSVPNDQTAFAESLYGRDYVCKAGSIWMRYGIPYTEDSLVCTGFEGDGQTTNFGGLRN
jgi:hypothetical protein